MRDAEWRQNIYYATAWLVVITFLTGCSAWPIFQPRPEVALGVRGQVAVNGTWDAKRLQSLGLVELVAFQPNGEEMIDEGVLLKDFLDAIEPAPDASQVIFTNANGDRVEMPLDEAQACEKCLVAFDPMGSGLHLTMPGLPAKLWVRNLVGIELQ
jgi:hypothetical protein